MEKVILYRKERETLDFIKEYMFEHQIAPSLREIKASFGQKSISTIHKSLGQLESKGFITRNKHQNRSIALTELALEYFGLKPVNALPLLGSIKPAINEIQFADTASEYIEVTEGTNIAGRYAAQISDGHMVEAFLSQGDYIILEKAEEFPANKVALVILNKRLHIRRLIQRSNGQVILRAENPDYDDIIVNETDKLTIVDKLIRVVRNYE